MFLVGGPDEREKCVVSLMRGDVRYRYWSECRPGAAGAFPRDVTEAGEQRRTDRGLAVGGKLSGALWSAAWITPN